MTDINHSMPIIVKARKMPTFCRVCGATALYSYVGVVVCSSCKMFFKRNALPKQVRIEYIFVGVSINNEHVHVHSFLLFLLLILLILEIIEMSFQ
jgi:hypothetical protein